MRTTLLVVIGLVLASGCKKSHEEALKATHAACVEYLAAAEKRASCDALADLTFDVAKPFADVSNEKEPPEEESDFLTKCMDSIAENYTERCKDNASYKKAMDRLMFSVVQ